VDQFPWTAVHPLWQVDLVWACLSSSLLLQPHNAQRGSGWPLHLCQGVMILFWPVVCCLVGLLGRFCHPALACFEMLVACIRWLWLPFHMCGPVMGDLVFAFFWDHGGVRRIVKPPHIELASMIGFQAVALGLVRHNAKAPHCVVTFFWVIVTEVW